MHILALTVKSDVPRPNTMTSRFTNLYQHKSTGRDRNRDPAVPQITGTPDVIANHLRKLGARC